jgi:hypothetical protein
VRTTRLAVVAPRRVNTPLPQADNSMQQENYNDPSD